MKKLILTSFAVILGLCAVSCSGDPIMDAVAPTFENVTINPSQPHCGETITATINYASEGNNWYNMKFSYTISSANTKTRTVDTTYSHINSLPPTFTFSVPDTIEQYTLTVNVGSVNASTLFAPSGSLYGSATLKNKTIRFTPLPKE